MQQVGITVSMVIIDVQKMGSSRVGAFIWRARES